MEGIKLFRQNFQNKFGIITFVIEGINDNERSALALKNYITTLNPNYLFLYNYQCCGYSPISQNFKNFLKELYEGVPFYVISKL
jgi:wyosine [tRNA(Phe)-imidazoG37] synthetase (radical SAM superfamily)